ncbi:MAG: hypothetical protein QW638_03875 [Candidatus Bathyarchaeia archaeon]|nr:hypothetical protein [Candidatus Bathyarchaeota archaeon]
MAVRVKLRIRAKGSGGEAVSPALVNSGFETEKPQLLIPVGLARVLGLWPPPITSLIAELGTAGGPVRNYLVPNALEVSILTEERTTEPVECDAIISHIEEEVLINDKLSDELKIVMLKPGAGIWRFTDDPEGLSRRSEPPRYWI